MKKIISSFGLAFLIVVLMAQSVLAATANLKFYTTDTDPKTGDVVEFDLKVDGNTKTPYYTYVVNLQYDASKLKFESMSYGDGWIPVEVDSSTDIEKGVIKRTAGFPNGASKVMTVMKYKFKALAPGSADVKITGEAAIDQENQSAELQNKKITLQISGKELTEEIVALKNQNISLNIVGDSVFKDTESYQFKVEHILENDRQTIGTTTVTVLDINGQKIMEEARGFNLSSKTNFDFSILAGALVAGTYTISAESVFAGQTQSNRQVKEIVITGEATTIANDSDNVFINIANSVWSSIVNNWTGIVGVLALLIALNYFWSKTRRYRRQDGR